MIIILTIFTDEEISNRGQMTRLAAEAAFYKTFSIMPITFLEGKALKTVEEVYFYQVTMTVTVGMGKL